MKSLNPPIDIGQPVVVAIAMLIQIFFVGIVATLLFLSFN